MVKSSFHPLKILYILPKNWLSFGVGILVSQKWPLGLSGFIRDRFIRHFKVDVSEAEFPVAHYNTLGSFFVRRLKIGTRPISNHPMVSPVDGTLVQTGILKGSDPIFQQIKGKTYPLSRLIGGDYKAEDFSNGGFATLYLAPYNYHRIHSPQTGVITKVTYIPGSLWPVNTWSVQNIDGLFASNERVVVHLSSEKGRMLVIMVGATNVGQISMLKLPQLRTNLPTRRDPQTWDELSIPILAGEELGCFHMGSTVILVTDSNLAQIRNEQDVIPRSIKVGEALFF